MSCFCGLYPGFSPNVSNTFCERISTTNATIPPSVSIANFPSPNTSGRWGAMGIVVYEDITNLPKPITLGSTITNSGVTTRGNQNIKKCNYYVHAGSAQVGYSSNILKLEVGGPGHGFGQTSNSPTFYGPPIELGPIDTTVGGNPSCSGCQPSSARTWGNPLGWTNSVSTCPPSCRSGRLGKVGIWGNFAPLPSFNTWYGFVSCITLTSTQTIYIGMGADDDFRFYLNNQLLVSGEITNAVGLSAYGGVNNISYLGEVTYVNWNVFPITLNAGTYTFSLEAKNRQQVGVMGAEIYTGVTDVQDFRTMTIQPGLNAISNYLAFSTLDRVGQGFQSGQITCPSGYFLSNCSGSLTCLNVMTLPCAVPPPSPTSTSTPTPTPTKTSTPTPTPTNTLTQTPTPTMSPGTTPTPTSTITPTPTITQSVTPTITPTKTPTPTPTPNYEYLQFGYVQANECDVITIYPMEVTCLTTPTSTGAGNSNGIIELLISGGALPYTITMTDSNGQSSLVGQVIYNLPTGTYSFVVVDYFGDFTATTTCTISSIPASSTPTPTPTSTPPSCFCLSFIIWPCTVIRTASSIPIVRTFCRTSDINGSPAWISNTGQEVIYYGLVTTNGSANLNPTYQISGSTLSPLMGPDFVVNGQPCNTIINRVASPNSRVFDDLINGTYWSLINTINNRTSVFNITKGNC